jgi:phenylacetate-coenzyme A ligase PaaK-like adenylate-forming protein
VRALLPEHLDRLGWSADRIASHQRDALRKLLRTAIDGSPFHARRLAGLEPYEVGLDDLASLPVMTKAEMMDSFDEVVTDRRVTRRSVEDHLARTGWDAEEMPGRFVAMASGGSSGQRGVFVYSRAAATEYTIACTRPGIARMVALIGDLPADPVPVAMVGAPSAVHATRLMPSLFGGDFMDMVSIPATAPLASIVERLNDVQPLLLAGYPSTIRKLADERLAGRLCISPLGVTTSSEPLSSADRARIDEAFGVGVVDAFGSSEGLIGSSAPDDPAIVLASDLAIVEPVDALGRPVPPGTPSAKVYVTNLFNTTQPLIRYELTDSFTVLPAAGTDGHLRVRVEGRSDDEFLYGDVVVHPIVVRSVMVKTPAAVEYQARQTPRGIEVDVVAPGGLDRADVAARLEGALGAAGLADPEVTVRIVGDGSIDRHPETGKTRRFVRLTG